MKNGIYRCFFISFLQIFRVFRDQLSIRVRSNTAFYTHLRLHRFTHELCNNCCIHYLIVHI